MPGLPIPTTRILPTQFVAPVKATPTLLPTIPQSEITVHYPTAIPYPEPIKEVTSQCGIFMVDYVYGFPYMRGTYFLYFPMILKSCTSTR